MGFTFSPLRYPGGKSRLRRFMVDAISRNCLRDGHYFEPFAGGAGIAWALLLGDHVDHVHINDIDPAIYAFWLASLNEPDEFCNRLHEVTISLDEWNIQKQIYLDTSSGNQLDLGFATFFLNRTNRSGIIGGGPIGGKSQNGKYKMDARFNRVDLAKRINRLASLRSRISIYMEDAIDFIEKEFRLGPERSFLFADPPYFGRGDDLYANPYSEEDHEALAKLLVSIREKSWILTYDDHPRIRELYHSINQISYGLSYSAQNRYKGTELLIISDGVAINTSLLPRKSNFEWVNQLELPIEP